MKLTKDNILVIVWIIVATMIGATFSAQRLSLGNCIVGGIAGAVLTAYMAMYGIRAAGLKALWRLLPPIALAGVSIVLYRKGFAVAEAVLYGFYGYAMGMFVPAAIWRLTTKKRPQ